MTKELYERAKANAPDIERVAMFCAFQIFKDIHGSSISPDAQSPHGKSWHEFYRDSCIKALSEVYEDGKVFGRH